MKRLISLLLAVTFTLSACTSPEVPESEETQNPIENQDLPKEKLIEDEREKESAEEESTENIETQGEEIINGAEEHIKFFNSILEREDLTDWQRAYAEFFADLNKSVKYIVNMEYYENINNFDNINVPIEYMYSIYIKDLKNNGIPEIIIKIGTAIGFASILSYIDGNVEVTVLGGFIPFYMYDTDKIFVRTWHMHINFFTIHNISENGYELDSEGHAKMPYWNDEREAEYFVNDIEITEEQFYAYIEEIMAMDLEPLYLTRDEIDFYEYLNEKLFYSV